ncbi:MAG: YdeI/OmpD-associated family protein [Thermodesulfobacteriota bacterium]
MPAYVKEAISESGVEDAYDGRPAYQRNDYIRWIDSAKRMKRGEKLHG